MRLKCHLFLKVVYLHLAYLTYYNGRHAGCTPVLELQTPLVGLGTRNRVIAPPPKGVKIELLGLQIFLVESRNHGITRPWKQKSME